MPELYGGQPDTFIVQAAATGPISGKKANSWLHQMHKDYEEFMPKWQQVCDFYLGEVADYQVGKKYLIQRYQGETDPAYTERCKLADYTPHLGTLLDSLAGMLFAVEDRASRVWEDEKGNGLGDPAVPGTPAHALLHSADGKGTMWQTLWRSFTIDVIMYERMWVLIDTVNDQHVVKLVAPTRVPNWVDGDNGVTSALMKELPRRGDLKDTKDPEPSWIEWRLDGWTRYTESQEGLPIEQESGTYTYVDRNANPTLPIFRVKLPLRRYIAWLLAKKAAVIFNQESVRDFSLRTTNFPKLVLGIDSEEQFEQLEARLLKGQQILPEPKEARGGHRFIAPDSGPITVATDVLVKKIEDFFVAGFKLYGDAAREKTATEIKQDVAAGVGAFLQLLKAAVDDAENGAMFRLEQANFAETASKWGAARVERSDDFSSVDLSAILDEMLKRYVGATGTIPVGRSALIEMAKDAARQDGLPVNEDEIIAATDAQLIAKLLPQLESLGVTPAAVKSRLAMRLVSALGLIDPKEEIAMADGTKTNLLTQLSAEAEKLANEQQDAARLAAQVPPAGGGGFGK